MIAAHGKQKKGSQLRVEGGGDGNAGRQLGADLDQGSAARKAERGLPVSPFFFSFLSPAQLQLELPRIGRVRPCQYGRVRARGCGRTNASSAFNASNASLVSMHTKYEEPSSRHGADTSSGLLLSSPNPPLPLPEWPRGMSFRLVSYSRSSTHMHAALFVPSSPTDLVERTERKGQRLGSRRSVERRRVKSSVSICSPCLLARWQTRQPGVHQQVAPKCVRPCVPSALSECRGSQGHARQATAISGTRDKLQLSALPKYHLGRQHHCGACAKPVRLPLAAPMRRCRSIPNEPRPWADIRTQGEACPWPSESCRWSRKGLREYDEYRQSQRQGEPRANPRWLAPLA